MESTILFDVRLREAVTSTFTGDETWSVVILLAPNTGVHAFAHGIEPIGTRLGVERCRVMGDGSARIQQIAGGVDTTVLIAPE